MTLSEFQIGATKTRRYVLTACVESPSSLRANRWHATITRADGGEVLFRAFETREAAEDYAGAAAQRLERERLGRLAEPRGPRGSHY